MSYGLQQYDFDMIKLEVKVETFDWSGSKWFIDLHWVEVVHRLAHVSRASSPTYLAGTHEGKESRILVHTVCRLPGTEYQEALQKFQGS